MLHVAVTTRAMPDWQQSLNALIQRVEPEIVALRRLLHAHPEPSGQELKTSLELYQRLGDSGLTVRMGPDGCGVIADSPHADGRRIAMRADIDALRIHDEKPAPYCSTVPGVMHACGLDAHAAIVCGAAIALERWAADGNAPWPISWRAIFQPSEETATGARQMIAAGALDDVRQIFALHVDPTRRVGEIGVRTGAFTANCDALDLTVRGRGGHGARPHESRDPIAAAAQLISTLYQFVPRATDSLDSVVVSFGRVRGGENSNVIPEVVELGGTIRTLDGEVRRQTIDHIRRLSRGVEEVTDTQISVNLGTSIPSVHNDASATQTIVEAATPVLGAAAVGTIPRPSMGSEDFACYLDHCPGAMFRLGTARDMSAITPLHTPLFDIDESALVLGAQILAAAVVIACRPAAPTGP
jgi:amidohydrolase